MEMFCDCFEGISYSEIDDAYENISENFPDLEVTDNVKTGVENIYKYADEHLQSNLAISLHAPNNELRSRLMKVNRAYPLEKVMEAVRYYEKETKRRVTYE